MAIGKKFPDFQLANIISENDYLVGYNADATSEIRTSVQSVIDAVQYTQKSDITFTNDTKIASSTVTDIVSGVDTVLDSFDLSRYATAKYIVNIRNDSTFCAGEVLVTHFSGNSYFTSYGIIGDESLLNLSTSISANTIWR